MDTLTRLKNSWGDVVDRIETRTPVGAMLAQQCVPEAINDGVIELRLPTQIGVDMLNDEDEGRRVFEEAICKVLAARHGTFTVIGVLK